VKQETVQQIAVVKVIPTTDNPRRRPKPKDADIQELAASIKAHGLLHPVLVRPYPKKAGYYDLRIGHRRLVAHRAIGLETIAAIVRPMDDRKAAEVTVLENLQREDLTPLEEGRGIQTLLEKGDDVAAIAARLGRPAPWVYRRASLVRLCPRWARLAEDPRKPHSKLSAGHLEVVARFPVGTQERLLDQLRWDIERGESVEAFRERAARAIRDLSKAPWKEDGTPLLKGMCTCEKCGHRSSKHRELWEGQKADACLDEKCWKAKEAAWLKEREAALRKAHGKALRHHRFERVSMEQITPHLVGVLRKAMRAIVETHPSKGKTIALRARRRIR